MNHTATQHDDELAALLDAALRDSRRVQTFDVTEWRRAHPHLNSEDVTLLDMLLELSQAVNVWQQSDDTGTLDDDDATGGATLLIRRNGGRLGRYQLLRHVGSGSMGDVYEANDPQLERCVAVKVPRCDRMSRNAAMFTQRFIREARAAAAVRHANICPIYDAGDSEGQVYVVMAFVKGESLDAVLSRGRIADIRKAVQIAIQVADALSAIHQHGIIHRDLKPGNILIDTNGQALLTDFGLALSDTNSERITSDGLIIGTPVYMPPEQAAGENSKLTPAADLYSLGAVLYEMLTGQAPFRAPLPELLRKIMLQTPLSPVELRPEVGPALSAILEKALAKIPSERYASAAAFADALREWDGSITSGVVSHLPQTTTSKWSNRRLTSLAVFITGTLCVVVIAFLLRPGQSGRDQHVTTTGNSVNSAESGTRSDAQNAGVVASIDNLAPPGQSQTLPAELNASLNITVSSDPERGPVTKTRVPVTEPGALPVRTGELVRFEVQMNQPAYVYLLWVSPDGKVEPVYPWDSEHHPGWNAPLVAGGDQANDHVLCPLSPREGFRVIEPMGLQTVVLLARRKPLDQAIDLARVLTELPATPMLTMNSQPGPILRGLQTGQTASTEDRQFDELKKRLSPHFEFMRVMSFPQVAALDQNASDPADASTSNGIDESNSGASTKTAEKKL